MNKRIRNAIIAGVAAAFAGATLAADATNFPPVEMTLTKVSPRVYYVQGMTGVATEHEGFISNAAAVLTDEGWVVIDALGTPALAEMFWQRLRQVSDKPVKRVYVTHYHADHFYGLQVFKALGAEVYAPAEIDGYLASDVAQQRLAERRESLKPWVNAATRLITPDHYVKDESSFRLGGVDFEVKRFGSAHSEGDLAVFVASEKVLLSGDLVFGGRIPYVGGDNVAHWIAKLDELAQVPAAAVVPGHGAAFTDVAKGVRLTHDYLQLLHTKMGAAAADLVPFDEAYAAVDWGPFKDLPAFEAGNRRNAYRVYTALEAASFGK